MRRALVLSLVLVTAVTGDASAPADAGVATRHRVLIPIGGDYSLPSLRSFLSVAAAGATGPTLDVLVVPAAYGHAPSVPANVKLALRRTERVRGVCESVLLEFPALDACSVSLLKTFRRPASYRPANVARVDDAGLDAMYFLGGIQGIAMHILGGTPLEDAMGRAYERGVVVGGTSAGDAVLSRTMIAGFAHGYGAETELRQDAVLIDWSDGADPTRRGLAFGSERAIYDEHYYERGRFGRLVNIVAQSGDHFGGAGRVGVGVDFRTGTSVADDAALRTFGKTSAAVIDFGTAGATHAWVGADRTLSARNVLTHLIATGRGVRYDLATRTPSVDGSPVSFVPPGPWPAGTLDPPGPGTLVLGGDLFADLSGTAMRTFVARATASGRDRIVAVFAAFPGPARAARYAEAYRRGLEDAGWTGGVDVFQYGDGRLPSTDDLRSAAGVMIVGGDQSLLAGPLSDPRFVAFAHDAVAVSPVVLTDGAMTAAAGHRYVANPDPTSLDLDAQGMAAFRTAYNRIAPGLDIVPGADLEPSLTRDYRWGRLYGLARSDPGRIVFGVCASTAIVVDPAGAKVVGTGSVVSADARTARFLNGTNGALTAFDVLMDLFAPGDAVEG